MYDLYQLALLDICMINIGSVIGIGRFWQKYNRYRYNQKLPYWYTSNTKTIYFLPRPFLSVHKWSGRTNYVVVDGPGGPTLLS